MGSDVIASLFSNVWSVVLIVVFFGGSIFVHEYGHFLAARRRGLKVERFSIGFGPRLFGWTGRDGVDYRISWLPLGGYVLIPQLADLRGIEGEGSDASGLPPAGYWDKMIVAVMGAVFNLVFALLIATVLWFVGVPKAAEQTTTVVGAVAAELTLPDGSVVAGPAFEAGVRVLDRIVAVDGHGVDDWIGVQQTIAAGSARDLQGNPRAVLTVERDGRMLDLTVFPRVAGEDRFRMVGIEPARPLVVAAVEPGTPAEAAGLAPGDRLVAVDGVRLAGLRPLLEHLSAHRDRDVVVAFERDGETRTVPLRPYLARDAEGREVARLGVALASLLPLRQDPLTQLRDHVVMLTRVLGGLLSPTSDLGLRHMSGPIGIAHGLYTLSQLDLRLVLWFVVLINVNLAVLNLLPVPVLDGGHMLFATIGRLRGRDLPPAFIQGLQSVFVLLLLGVFLYVSVFDSKRVLRDVTDAPPPPAAAPATPAPAEPVTPSSPSP